MKRPIWVRKFEDKKPLEPPRRTAACRDGSHAETCASERPNLGLGFVVTVTAALLFYGALGALVRHLS